MRGWLLLVCLGLCACWDFELHCAAGGACPQGFACNAAQRCVRADFTGDPLGAPNAAPQQTPGDGGPGLGGAAAGGSGGNGAVGGAVAPASIPAAAPADSNPLPGSGWFGGSGVPALGSRADAGTVCGASFRGLGFYPGQTDSRALGVSAGGSLAMGTGRVQGSVDQAIAWRIDEGLVGRLPSLARLERGVREELPSAALAASQNGEYVVGYRESEVRLPDNQNYLVEVAFLVTLASGVLVPMFEGGRALGVSGDGAVIVGWSGTPREAFRWTAAERQQLLGRIHGLSSSQATAVSQDGRRIVGLGTLPGGDSHALLWTESGELVDLGVLAGGAASAASATNFDGSVVVGTSESALGLQAFRWTSAGAQLAGLAPLERASATDATGTRVVGSSQGRAAYWDGSSGVVRLLDEELGELVPSGWRLQEATGVSADGQVIVGYGQSPNAPAEEAWVARLGPPCAAPAESDAGTP